MATKGGREKIKLVSTADTGHFYTTTKNKKTMPEKMLIMKFDPKARKHVEYKESKIKEAITDQHLQKNRHGANHGGFSFAAFKRLLATHPAPLTAHPAPATTAATAPYIQPKC